MHNGQVTSDHLRINDAFRYFYSCLYSSESPPTPDVIMDFLNNIDIPTLPMDSGERLDEPVGQESSP